MRIRCVPAMVAGVLLAVTAVSCQSLFDDPAGEETAFAVHPNTARGAALLYGLRGESVDYPEAMRLLLQAGATGDALALYYRGIALADGWSEDAPDALGARRLIDRCYLPLRRGAVDGNVEALYAVGEITASGRKEPANWEQAEAIYRFCMEKGFLPANREMGRHAVETGDYAAAIVYLIPAVKAGDAVAEYWLARAYLEQRQPEKAREHLLNAARLGAPSAMYEVAARAVNPAERERWMLRAARAGIGRAQYELACDYETSQPDLSRYWLNLAVTHGDAAAMRHLAQSNTMRSFEVNRMVLLLLARQGGDTDGIEAEIAAADVESGLYWPAVYSSLGVLNSGANYGLLSRDILQIADDFRNGEAETARNDFAALVRAQGAALPPSLIWFHFWRCGLPLGWLAEEPASADLLGRAVAAGLAGDGAKQRDLAHQLSWDAARRHGEAQRVGGVLAAILTANAWMLEENSAVAHDALAACGALTEAETPHAVNFINEFCPALRRDPALPAEWLKVAPTVFKPASRIVRQAFP